jgi:hypothetical protein
MAALTPNDDGTVNLRGHSVDIVSDVGQAFVTDCVRHIEGLISAELVQKKYQLDEATWEALGPRETLQQAVGSLKERRILDGTAARERAAYALVGAVGIIDGIVKDNGSPPRSRIDGTRELRAIAAKTDDVPVADRERFVININFGSAKIVKEIELKPKPEASDDFSLVERDAERDEEIEDGS